MGLLAGRPDGALMVGVDGLAGLLLLIPGSWCSSVAEIVALGQVLSWFLVVIVFLA